MGSIRPVKRVQLITGLISGDVALFGKAKRCLERICGPADFESGILDFTHTDYYAEEFGSNLKRMFLGFKKLFSLDKLYTIKLKTNSLEKKFSKSGNRTINIDPGYLDISKLVLFSTKDYSHRIYTGKGIYAEVTLFYKNKRFNPWPWTYPDFKTEEYLNIFDSIRELYREKTGSV